MKFEYQNKSIEYSISGVGEVVFLLHGYMENSRMWDFVIPDLTDKYRVLLMDLPDHGFSDAWDSDYSMEILSEIIMSLLRSLHIDKLTFVGHSLGGYIALAFSKMYPNVVSKLVLYHSTTLADTDEIRARRAKGNRILKIKPRTAIRSSFSNLFFNKENNKESIEEYTQEALMSNPDGCVRANKSMASRKDNTDVIKYKRPTYIIAGKHDPLLSSDSIQVQMDILDKANSYWLEDSGHMSHIESPDLAKDILLLFINS